MVLNNKANTAFSLFLIQPFPHNLTRPMLFLLLVNIAPLTVISIPTFHFSIINYIFLFLSCLMCSLATLHIIVCMTI